MEFFVRLEGNPTKWGRHRHCWEMFQPSFLIY